MKNLETLSSKELKSINGGIVAGGCVVYPFPFPGDKLPFPVKTLPVFTVPTLA